MKLVWERNFLSDDDIKRIELVLKEFPTVLTGTPGLTDVVTMKIDTGDHTPVLSRPYQITPKWFEPLKKEVNTLLEAGIISHSTSH